MKNQPVVVLMLLTGILSVGGCASQPTRDFEAGKKQLSQGQVEPGLAQLAQAAKGDPENVEYQQYLYKQREKAVNQLLQKAESERGNGLFDDAVNDYKQVLAIDPNNQRAGEGMDQVQGDKRRRQQLAEAAALFKKGDTESASATLRRILAEDPLQREARELQRQVQEKTAEDNAASGSPTIRKAMKKTLSLEFRDADLKSVFSVISRVSGLNFVFDKDIKPELKTTILVKDMTIEDAIRLVLVTNQLQQEVINENTIIIYPDTPAKIKDYQQQVVKSFYLANADVKKTLEMIKTILKAKDVFIDDRRNLLVMRDTPEVIRLAEKLIAAQDLPDPEVELEVEILEVNTSHLANLGLQSPQKISATLGNAGSFTANQWLNRDSNFLTYHITDPAVALNLQKTDTDTTLLANPRIRVKDREKANIHIGQRLPVLTSVATAGVGSSESVNYIDVGLKLDVEPSIRLDDEVDMKVKLEVSSVNKTITLSSGTQVYELGTRNADTVLRLKDGETQVLAGLIRNDATSTVDKLPGLGDIPLFGRLFSNDNSNKQKTDLVLLITPHVVRNVTRPDEISNQFPSGTDNDIGSAPKNSPALVPVQINVEPVAQVKSPNPPEQQSIQKAASSVGSVPPVAAIEQAAQTSKPEQSAVPATSP